MHGQVDHHSEEGRRKDVFKFGQNYWDFLFEPLQNSQFQFFTAQLPEKISQLCNCPIDILVQIPSHASRQYSLQEDVAVMGFHSIDLPCLYVDTFGHAGTKTIWIFDES